MIDERFSQSGRWERPVFAKADRTLLPWQRITLLALLVALVAGALVSVRTELLIINAAITAFYLVSTLYRLLLIDLSLRQRHEIDIPACELGLPAETWPRYLVLVPLYHEGDILPSLLDSLSRLDYPRDKLEIRLLVEADDEETRGVLHKLAIEPPFTVQEVPVSNPRTKPKACNAGLGATEAEYVVVYDAEDRPEPDQLKKAVVAFADVPQEVACIQAKLNFYNPDQNVLTRCFAAEYAMWFDMCLPGLDSLHAPIPLGGTSNHFRAPVLRDIGGWDEYNVTEDCDLGLRLFARGWRTRILNSTTWEQACPDIGFWLRQRSRWVKGYIQTYLVHMRRPVRQARDLGFLNTLHFHLLIGGSPFCQLINPVYWCLTLLWFIFKLEEVSVFFPGPVFAMAAFCLFVGNFTFAYSCGIACVRRNLGRLTAYGLLMPLYWALMSVAAWKGTLQLVRRPHFWEKTRHFAATEP